MSFDRFVLVEQVFFEEYGKIEHPFYKTEESLIKTFEKHNAGYKPNFTLSKWCIRYELNKEEMIINNMDLDTIIIRVAIRG